MRSFKTFLKHFLYDEIYNPIHKNFRTLFPRTTRYNIVSETFLQSILKIKVILLQYSEFTQFKKNYVQFCLDLLINVLLIKF